MLAGPSAPFTRKSHGQFGQPLGRDIFRKGFRYGKHGSTIEAGTFRANYPTASNPTNWAFLTFIRAYLDWSADVTLGASITLPNQVLTGWQPAGQDTCAFQSYASQWLKLQWISGFPCLLERQTGSLGSPPKLRAAASPRRSSPAPGDRFLEHADAATPYRRHSCCT